MKQSIAIICILLQVICIHSFPLEEEKYKDEGKQEKLEACKLETGLPDVPHGSPRLQGTKVKCFHACMMEKEGFMINGKIDFEKVFHYTTDGLSSDLEKPKNQLKFIVETANQENDKCEVASLLADTWYR